VDLEKRFLDFPGATISTRAKAGQRYIDGILPYGSESEDMGFLEIIDRGAFRSALAGENVFAFWAHDEAAILGSTDARTLTLADDPSGLRFSIRLRNSAAGEDYFEAIQRGDVVGVSFGFICRRDEIDAQRRRHLLDVQLLEISVGVAFPAYAAATSSADKRRQLAGEEAALRARLDAIKRTWGFGKYAPPIPSEAETAAIIARAREAIG
jgi:uncharacterized protein